MEFQLTWSTFAALVSFLLAGWIAHDLWDKKKWKKEKAVMTQEHLNEMHSKTIELEEYKGKFRRLKTIVQGTL